ncbi:MAG: hypothetical protein J7604_07960 [Sporocytophaga sp.]|uniref:hypothetical protein n=1 Tax=Sporocytophaga sp. TaxID=2231183 RepID=UPI001B02A279|nr:hypothetical protein [Sporocytophaga sp.]MBO9700132.1 hypothetical protein [Sporocytophaga sp.]
MSNLFALLKESSFLVSDQFYKTYRLFFNEEHLTTFCQKLIQYQNEGLASKERLPFFDKECTPSLQDAYIFFENSMNDWKKEIKANGLLAKEFARSIEAAGIENILLLMGQRLTPGSVTDVIPPLQITLIESASKIFDQTLTVAAREWTKHTNRSQDSFWGKIEGDNEFKNRKAISFIEHILHHATWWNVYYHFKHQLVFEVRISTGHGARWTSDGQKFIGFIEPFI